MTTWFAQNSSVNIDSVNQWNSAANGSGSWLTWASLDAGDVLVANGKTSIAINVNVTCATITNLATGGTASGGFLLAAGITVTANITSGTSNCITRSASGADSYIVGNVTGGSVSLGVGLVNDSTGIVRITGNVTGGSVSSNPWGVYNTSSGHIYITGNVTCPAGNVFQGFAVYNTGTGNIYITGNVTGTGSYPAVQNNSTGRVYVTGNVTGGSSGANAVGIQNQSTGIVVVNGTITGGTNGPGYVGIVAGSLFCHTGDRVTGSGAIDAVCGIGRVRIGASQQTTFSLMTYDTSALTETASRSLYTGGVNLNQPATANVRSGTTFGAASEYTGTLAVPSPTLVAIGVSTDNTVGSYSPTGGLDAAGVRSAIGLASANLDTQLSGINSKTTNLPTDPADQSLIIAATDAILTAVNTKASQISVDDLPTNGELATALATSDDATLAAIAAEAVKTADIQSTLAAGVVLDSADKATLVDLIWDEVLTGATHNIASSSGKRLRQTTAFQQIDSTVIDASATTTTFITGLTSSVDNFYNDSMLVFTDGALAGQVRAIYDYIGATKTIILEEALTSAPVDGVAFAIVSLHIHPVSQIQSGLATAAALATESTKINRIEAVATGTVTGAGTSTEVFVGPSATLTITVDSSGNRSAVVVT